MFISRLPLNAARIGAAKLINAPYRMHAAVEASFPPDSDGDADGRILWRVDHDSAQHSVWLYVVSPTEPDFTHIIEQAGWPSHMQWTTVDYSRMLESLENGQTFRFRLKANPSRRANSDLNPNGPAPVSIKGKIMPCVSIEQKISWLGRQAAAHGFSITEHDGHPQVSVTEQNIDKLRRKGSIVTMRTSMFTGLLTITDVDKFRHALTHGIGRGKGFGCGLLTIR